MGILFSCGNFCRSQSGKERKHVFISTKAFSASLLLQHQRDPVKRGHIMLFFFFATKKDTGILAFAAIYMHTNQYHRLQEGKTPKSIMEFL